MEPIEEVEGKLTLGTLGGGAAEEKFALALKDVMANIRDINTDANKPRKIVLELTISPERGRKSASYSLTCSTKLVPAASFSGDLFLEHSKNIAFEQDPDQEPIQFENVKPLDKKGS